MLEDGRRTNLGRREREEKREEREKDRQEKREREGDREAEVEAEANGKEWSQKKSAAEGGEAIQDRPPAERRRKRKKGRAHSS